MFVSPIIQYIISGNFCFVLQDAKESAAAAEFYEVSLSEFAFDY